MMRRTEILGQVIRRVAETAGQSYRKVAEVIQNWSEQMGHTWMHVLHELDKKVPAGEVSQALSAQEGTHAGSYIAN